MRKILNEFLMITLEYEGLYQPFQDHFELTGSTHICIQNQSTGNKT